MKSNTSEQPALPTKALPTGSGSTLDRRQQLQGIVDNFSPVFAGRDQQAADTREAIASSAELDVQQAWERINARQRMRADNAALKAQIESDLHAEFGKLDPQERVFLD